VSKEGFGVLERIMVLVYAALLAEVELQVEVEGSTIAMLRQQRQQEQPQSQTEPQLSANLSRHLCS